MQFAHDGFVPDHRIHPLEPTVTFDAMATIVVQRSSRRQKQEALSGMAEFRELVVKSSYSSEWCNLAYALCNSQKISPVQVFAAVNQLLRKGHNCRPDIVDYYQKTRIPQLQVGEDLDLRPVIVAILQVPQLHSITPGSATSRIGLAFAEFLAEKPQLLVHSFESITAFHAQLQTACQKSTLSTTLLAASYLVARDGQQTTSEMCALVDSLTADPDRYDDVCRVAVAIVSSEMWLVLKLRKDLERLDNASSPRSSLGLEEVADGQEPAAQVLSATELSQQLATAEQSLSIGELTERVKDTARQLKIAVRELEDERVPWKDALEHLRVIAPSYYAAMDQSQRVDHPVNNLVMMVVAAVRLSRFLDQEPAQRPDSSGSYFAQEFLKRLGAKFDPIYSPPHFLALEKAIHEFAVLKKEIPYASPQKFTRKILGGLLAGVVADPNFQQDKFSSFIKEFPKLLRALHSLVLSCDQNARSNSKETERDVGKLALGMIYALRAGLLDAAPCLTELVKLIGEKVPQAQRREFLSAVLPQASFNKNKERLIGRKGKGGFWDISPGYLGAVLGKTRSGCMCGRVQELSKLMQATKSWENDPQKLLSYLHYRATSNPASNGETLPFSPFREEGPFSSIRCRAYLNKGWSVFLIGAEYFGAFVRAIRSLRK